MRDKIIEIIEKCHEYSIKSDAAADAIIALFPDFPGVNIKIDGLLFNQADFLKAVTKAFNTIAPHGKKGPAMNIFLIVSKYLEDNGFDGLSNASLQCGCDSSDLFPCGSPHEDQCLPSYKVDCDKRCGEHGDCCYSLQKTTECVMDWSDE